MIRKIFAGLILLFLMLSGYGQQNNEALCVFFDCNYCDMDFIRKEITWINYVRDRAEADVHLLVTHQNTASGGDEYLLFFIGCRSFSGMTDTLELIVNTNNTEEETRTQMLHKIKLGLIRYVARTPQSGNITIASETKDTSIATEPHDPWNSWVFRLNSSLYLSGEKSYNMTNVNSYLSAERITEELKIEASLQHYFNKNKYVWEEDSVTNTLITETQSYYGSLSIVKSISDHFSAGFATGANSSTYSNLDLSVYFKPAIEYNLFPYSESARKQLRFKYSAGPVYYDYTDTTIYNETSECLLNQNLSIALATVQEWGSIDVSISGSTYLHDFSKNSLYAYVYFNIKLFKGLSFWSSGSYSFIHNQLSLPKGTATYEEILTRQRELESTFNFWMNAGIQYTFGSIYNNVVNPRFGN